MPFMPTDRLAMLNTMARMQEAHNLQVHPDWRTKRYEYYRAIWIECAELLDHFGWKWWKRQDPDLAQVKLELVDIWHFGLSELLRADAVEPELAVTLDVQPSEHPGPESVRQAVEALASACLASKGFSVERFAGVMRVLPMSFDELFRLYVGKNVLNGFRQDHGYKDGTYRKAWAGRED
ncbi:MAG: dUTP diphosphatase, partial [Gammaproteobacteria bacterium]|nr:dUTP diphosphatase [Gammaproteobacteria bacterium]